MRCHQLREYALEGHCLHHLILVKPVQVRRIAVLPDNGEYAGQEATNNR